MPCSERFGYFKRKYDCSGRIHKDLHQYRNRLLGELLEVCREVIVTVTMDDRENPYVYKHPYQLFALGKHTVTSLIQIAAERKVSVEDPLCLYERPLYRFCDNSAMEFLERNIFRYSKECYRKNREQSGYMWPEIQEKKR